ncbi:restriction endonuclease [Candidatus Woesearchaeota archaeon]|nr:restriction endonuclease [Candidatus Woesearchaeota archaeon]
MNSLFYGDNLDILRRYIFDESVDLCYVDPPFNSKRNYNQIYNNIGRDDAAQAQAFIDTWEWNELSIKGFSEIIDNYHGKFTSQTINLILGLEKVIGQGSLLAYLISITLRVVEIHRVLKSTGSFYLHCDPNSSHYLKLILDSIFCPQGGDFRNEIIWCYSHGGKSKRNFGKKHDVIFFYSKSKEYQFNTDNIKIEMKSGKKSFGGRLEEDEDGRQYRLVYGTKNKKGDTKYYKYYLDEGKIPEDWWSDINSLQASSAERLGYPTQKPEALLERIIQASSNEGDVVLDAYCGCGTTVAVAQNLNRKWIGIDITYQSISLILKRLEDNYGKDALDNIKLAGIPKDMDSATALANRNDDRTRKEFEKWVVLTYSNNRAIINQKKGADRGIDGFAYFLEAGGGHRKIVFQVKSGNVSSRDIRDLYGTVTREKGAMGIFLSLKKPSSEMAKEAKSCGLYQHEVMGRSYPVIQIVTVQDILEKGKRLEMPLSMEVLKSAETKRDDSQQLELTEVERSASA